MVNIIVAHDLNKGIGYNNRLPWDNKADLLRFKHLTTGHYVIMGRKTYESISKPLSNRTNIVITNGGYYIPSEHFGKIAYTKSLKAAIDYVTERDGVAFIIGGARIYQTAFYLGVVDRIYLTIIKNVHKCDVYFPQIPDNFKVVDSQDFKDRINLILEA